MRALLLFLNYYGKQLSFSAFALLHLVRIIVGGRIVRFFSIPNPVQYKMRWYLFNISEGVRQLAENDTRDIGTAVTKITNFLSNRDFHAKRDLGIKLSARR